MIKIEITGENGVEVSKQILELVQCFNNENSVEKSTPRKKKVLSKDVEKDFVETVKETPEETKEIVEKVEVEKIVEETKEVVPNEVEKIELSEIIDLAKEKATLVGRDKVKDLISSFGFSKISEIPEDKLFEFKNGLEQL